MKKRKMIIFDLDGTLYRLKGGSFRNSELQKRIAENVIVYVENKLAVSRKKASAIVSEIRKVYGENISIGLEKEYGFDRYDYFNTVWDVDPEGLVEKFDNLQEILLTLNDQYEFLLTSDAPLIWIKKVLKELDIESFFEGGILSGEGNKRKIFGNRFKDIISEYRLKPEQVISIGDQEETDILPAKKLGIRTVFVNKGKRSAYADISIKDISELESVFCYLFDCANGNGNLKDALDNLGIMDRYKVRILTGSSTATTFQYGKWIYKVGESETINEELGVYKKFREKLGRKFNRIFPDYNIIYDRDGVALCRIEMVGNRNLEDCLLSASPVANDNLLGINAAVLENIDIIFNASQGTDERDAKNFFDELTAAIRKNIKLSGMDSPEESEFIDKVRKNRGLFLKNFISSLSHRDFTAGNIVVDDAGQKVFFIDPKHALPYNDKSQSLGNVGIDLAGYYVTILRKELERRKIGYGPLKELKEEIIGRLDFYKAKGAISGEMIDLFLLYWFSVYTACKCAYCTSKERVWLYKEMAKAYQGYKIKISGSLKN